MRRNIAVDYGDAHSKIYFYTHWGAVSLDDRLRIALKRGRDRWNDPPYLARIIFSEMIHDDVDGLTGYGIAPYALEEEFATIEVDLEDCTVDGVPFIEFIAGARGALATNPALLS